jgi:hypothetical protein
MHSLTKAGRMMLMNGVQKGSGHLSFGVTSINEVRHFFFLLCFISCTSHSPHIIFEHYNSNNQTIINRINHNICKLQSTVRDRSSNCFAHNHESIILWFANCCGDKQCLYEKNTTINHRLSLKRKRHVSCWWTSMMSNLVKQHQIDPSNPTITSTILYCILLLVSSQRNPFAS